MTGFYALDTGFIGPPLLCAQPCINSSSLRAKRGNPSLHEDVAISSANCLPAWIAAGYALAMTEKIRFLLRAQTWQPTTTKRSSLRAKRGNPSLHEDVAVSSANCLPAWIAAGYALAMTASIRCHGAV
jgi:hypothetical protein